MKASNVVAPSKLNKIKPDLEEALDESDEGEDPAVAVDKEVKDEDDDAAGDLAKDKYVRQPKKKAAAQKGASAKKAGGKKNAGKGVDLDEEMEDDDDEEDVKPKKGKAGKGKAAASAKGKAKK